MALDVVTLGDGNIVLGIAVTIRSALEHSTQPLNINVICSGISATEKNKLTASWAHERLGTVRFLELSYERIRHFRSTLYLKSKLTYARMLMPELFPELDHCIYLDSDLLVCRDLSEAAAIDIRDHLIGAVRDVSVRTLNEAPQLAKRLGLKAPEDYVNTGFMLVNLAAWRSEGVQEKLVRMCLDRAHLLSAMDQDAENIVMEGRVRFLDSAWNTSQYEKPEKLEGSVVHLIGSRKPWHARYKSNFKDAYYRDVIYAGFIDVLDRTSYKGFRPWDPAGIGSIAEEVAARMPTLDMIPGKLYRMMKSAG